MSTCNNYPLSRLASIFIISTLCLSVVSDVFAEQQAPVKKDDADIEVRSIRSGMAENLGVKHLLTVMAVGARQ